MKKLFIATLAIAALASCNKDQVINFDKFPINFGEAFVDNSVRVDYSNANTLQGFNVYGTVTGTAGIVPLFDGDGATVSRNGAAYNAAWNCSESEYWIPGASYSFAAVVDATPTIVNGLPTALKTIADDAATDNMNLKDMLYATQSVAGTSVTADYNELVKFTFSHLLSKVKFTVKSNAEGTYKHTVTNITVSNYTEGTYTIDGGTWAHATATDKNVAFASIEGVTSTDTNGVSNADMLLVPTTSDFVVTFTVELYKGTTQLGTETKNITVSQDLVKGNAYNFLINCVVGKEIQFSVTNDPTWAVQPDITVQ
ncbi:MAG: fimbrillin family protein [Alistipes sp.]|nr:fimbrillin family protein [Alistipes sp.]